MKVFIRETLKNEVHARALKYGNTEAEICQLDRMVDCFKEVRESKVSGRVLMLMGMNVYVACDNFKALIECIKEDIGAVTILDNEFNDKLHIKEMDATDSRIDDRDREKKVGVFLFRGQPVHKAHMWHIEKALKENDLVCLVVGSSNKDNMIRNPFDIELRKKMVKEALNNIKDFDRVIMFELADWSQESITEDNSIWGHYLYYNVVSRIGQKKFKIYYSDEPEIIESWFDSEVRNFVELRLTPREQIFAGLSATRIREALLTESKEHNDYLKQVLPKNVYAMVPELRALWNEVYSNPKSDFTMC